MNPQLKELAEDVAKSMVSNSEIQKEFTVPNTQIKLYLVLAETAEAEKYNDIPGAFLGKSVQCDDKTFLIFRTLKS
jgi:hypothetical protein